MEYTAGQLAAAAAPPSAPDAPTAGGAARLWVRAGSQDFCLWMSEVDAVRDCPPLTPVPGAPAWLMGVGGHRGRLLPVVDLAAAQGGSAMPPKGSIGKLLMVDIGAHRLAFRVSEVSMEGASVPTGATPLAIRTVAARLLGEAFEPGLFAAREQP